MLNTPTNLFVTSLDEIYFADTNNHRIRKILTNGTIITIAGTGVSGYNGENILASKSLLSYPTNIVISNSGEIYISDFGNHKVRVIGLNGKIRTIIGNNPKGGFNGDGLFSNETALNFPQGLSVSAKGEVFIADTSNSKIRKIDLNGFTTTVSKYNSSIVSSVISLSSGTVLAGTNKEVQVLRPYCPGEFTTFNPDTLSCKPITCFGTLYSDPKVCSGAGKCTSFDTCNCDSHWFGDQCDLPMCFNKMKGASDVCSGNGQCISPDTCLCNAGFDGPQCEIPYCSGIRATNSSVCLGRGQCTMQQKCSCSKFYTGSNCEIRKCNGKTEPEGGCSYHGSCLEEGVCQCSGNFNPSTYCQTCIDGYSGPNCNIPSCYGFNGNDANVCSGKGKCIGINNCQCQQGFTGAVCQAFTCGGIERRNSSVCTGRGYCNSVDTCDCFNPNFNPTSYCASCKPDYAGVNCEQKICDAATTCSDNGVCNGLKCKCNPNILGMYCNLCAPGFVGKKCDIPCSAEKNCYSNGVCNPDGSCTCIGNAVGNNCESCAPGWFGSKCDYKIDSTSFKFNTNGDTIVGTIYTSITTKLQCNSLIKEMHKIGGDTAVCVYDATSQTLQISLGITATIRIGDTLAFYTYPNGGESTIDVSIGTGGFVAVSPVASLAVDKLIASPCDIINLDASGSVSTDRRSLNFFWNLENFPLTIDTPTLNSLKTLLSSSSTSGIASALPPGMFTAKVVVKSSFSGLTSEQVISFTVSATPSPKVSIKEGSLITSTIGFPSFANVLITLPQCYTGDGKVNYTYTQDVSPSILSVSSTANLVKFSTTQEGDFNIFATVSLSNSIPVSTSFTVRWWVGFWFGFG